MTSFSGLSDGRSMDAFIGIYDINGFSRIARSQTPRETLHLIQDLSAEAHPRIEGAGGMLIKHIGDAALFAFPDERADEAMSALFDLKGALEKLLDERGHSHKLTFSLHFGTVVFGRIPPIKNWDIIGDAVNILWTLDRGAGRGQVVISPQAFRKLEPGNRKRFRKHTPPIVYLSER